MHHASCKSLAKRIDNFMPRQDSFDLPAWEANTLIDKINVMIEQLEEVEDIWSKVPRTARETGPDDPGASTLLRDWANFVSIKCVVDKTLSAIEQYTFPMASTEKSDESLSNRGYESDDINTNSPTEDELDEYKDGSEYMAHSTLGMMECQACGTQ